MNIMRNVMNTNGLVHILKLKIFGFNLGYAEIIGLEDLFFE